MFMDSRPPSDVIPVSAALSVKVRSRHCRVCKTVPTKRLLPRRVQDVRSCPGFPYAAGRYPRKEIADAASRDSHGSAAAVIPLK
jgi:hypothetical protein